MQTVAPAAVDLRQHSKVVADEILAERNRQMDVEGWSLGHDDTHANGELACAAGCYALHAGMPEPGQVPSGIAPQDWPWSAEWWKPQDRRRDLVRAAALIVAEIERLDRSPKRQS